MKKPLGVAVILIAMLDQVQKRKKEENIFSPKE
jgi:hypothetical protein